MNRRTATSGRTWRGLSGALAALTLAAGLGGPVIAQGERPSNDNFTVVEPGEYTQERPYLVAEDPETLEIQPLLTTGEVVRGTGYQMAAAPDGLGAFQDGDDVVVFMNHELNAEEQEHISDARVSRLVLDGNTAAVRSGAYPINGSEGYRSLSSAFLAGPEVGFDDRVFLTGEENTGGERGGVAIGIDAESGDVAELPWLGHFKHENAVVVPGFDDQTVVFLTDDDPTGSEAYLYIADSPQDLLDGNGQLYVFVADDAEDSADVAKGGPLSDHFEPVDEGDNDDAEALQTAAEDAGTFTFVRLEDATYDRTTPNTIYFADTGDNGDQTFATPSREPLSANGRLYSMTLDPSDPTQVTSLNVLLDGDAGDDIRNPDNIDANASTILIQEDLNADNREADSDNTARILAYDIGSGAVSTLARVDQSDDPNRLVDEGDEAGSWESSGIIDVSDLFGSGSWLVDVQAHTMDVRQFDGVDEGGQLLLIRQITPPPTPVEIVSTAAVPVATIEPTATVAPTEAVQPTATPTAEPTTAPTVPPTPTLAPTIAPTPTLAPAPTLEPTVPPSPAA